MASLIKSREHDKKLPDPITGEKKSTITHSFVVGINLADPEECGRGFKFLSGSHFGYLGPMLLMNLKVTEILNVVLRKPELGKYRYLYKG